MVLTEDLPVTPDLNCGKVAEICAQFLELTDERAATFGIFVYDLPRDESLGADPGAAKAYADLERTPKPCQEKDFMGDVIVLKATRFVSAYAASLHALPHVIMVKPDLSDLVPTVRCLQRHDAAALRALRRGMAAATDLLSYENVLAYWADLLEHYAALQTFMPHVDARAVPASRLASGWLNWLAG